MTSAGLRGAPRTGCDSLGRAAALFTIASAVLHLWALPQLAAVSPALGLLIAGMAVSCLMCGRHLWCAPTVRIFALSAVMNAGMVATHLLMMPSSMAMSPSGVHPYGHEAVLTAVTPNSDMSGMNLMTAAIALALTELFLATAVVFFRTRSQPSIVGQTATTAWVAPLSMRSSPDDPTPEVHVVASAPPTAT
ncbi:MAG: hypothetical protein M3021_12745 [Actinomycetota bacterium]|nr:hypothetical protein [Actinomycetota bacterium]